jgi:uncharacterized protein (TIGR01244 family)
MKPSKRLAFGVAVLIGAGFVLVQPVYQAARKAWSVPATTLPISGTAATSAELQPLAPGLLVAGQIVPGDVAAVAQRGVRTIIAMRPDGEEAGQPSSASMAAAAAAGGVRFAYVPVPHGEMPDAVAAELAAALSAAGDGAVLLYCRSGRRAARAWALAEASRRDGLTVAEIEAAARRVGQSVDDLTGRIRGRVSARPS